MATLLLIGLLLLVTTGTEAGFPNVKPTMGEPWPLPQHIDYYYEKYFRVDLNEVPLNITGYTCPDLEDATARYQKMISDFLKYFHRTGYSKGRDISVAVDDIDVNVMTSIEVNLTSSCDSSQYPEFDMDESYELQVNWKSDARAVVTADSIWGIYRGLETMFQLFYVDDEVFAVFVRSSHVIDFPRYSHRGFLLDTGRHFLSVEVIKQNIDLMAFHKYNVFHWHIVDDQSFPFDSQHLWTLAPFGAYRPDKIYNPDDVANIIEYSRQRGIRVIPEFDTPGHTKSWGVGMPGILTDCYTNGSRDGTYGPLNPSEEGVYVVVGDLLNEVTLRFPDRYIHLGGDEVNFGYDCWLSNPQVQDWMKKRNISTPEEVEDVYIQRLLTLVEALPAKPEYVVWQDVIDHGVNVRPNTIVEVWKEPWQEELYNITSLGHRAILSTCWYLNRISYGIDWHQYYECEPEDMGGTDEQRALVMGGEAAMWGEYVDDSNVVSRTWPRAAAPAERLWSAKNVTSADDAAPRLEEQRCRLWYRGFKVGPANGPGFC